MQLLWLALIIPKSLSDLFLHLFCVLAVGDVIGYLNTFKQQ